MRSLRAITRDILLNANAASGMVTVPEGLFIELWHRPEFRDIEQIPRQDAHGRYFWSAALAPKPSGAAS